MSITRVGTNSYDYKRIVVSYALGGPEHNKNTLTVLSERFRSFFSFFLKMAAIFTISEYFKLAFLFIGRYDVFL